MRQYETQNDVTYFGVELLRVGGQWSVMSSRRILRGHSPLSL